jgi:hypothetical protein
MNGLKHRSRLFIERTKGFTENSQNPIDLENKVLDGCELTVGHDHPPEWR